MKDSKRRSFNLGGQCLVRIVMGKNGAKSLLHNAIMSKYRSGDAFVCFNLKRHS